MHWYSTLLLRRYLYEEVRYFLAAKIFMYIHDIVFIADTRGGNLGGTGGDGLPQNLRWGDRGAKFPP